jgi:hypothetical protein
MAGPTEQGQIPGFCDCAGMCIGGGLGLLSGYTAAFGVLAIWGYQRDEGERFR